MNEMTVKEVLIAARAKISDPANWTQKHFARTKEGIAVLESHPEAVCFCTAGAVYLVSPKGKHGYALDALSEVMGDSTSSFNDTHTHAEVLAKFDEAIAAQGGE